MKIFFFVLLGLFFVNLFYPQSHGQDLAQMIEDLDLNKAQIEKLIKTLEDSGKINKDEAKKARTDLAKMSDQDFEKIKAKTKKALKENTKDTSVHESDKGSAVLKLSK